MNAMDMKESRELDALVAEKIFKAPRECRLIGQGTAEHPFRLDSPRAAWRVRSDADMHWESWSPDGAERIVNDSVPHYSSHIVDAWLIIEHLAEQKLDWISVGNTEFSGEWGCVIGKTPASVVIGRAPTAPLAICRAALQAVTS